MTTRDLATAAMPSGLTATAMPSGAMVGVRTGLLERLRKWQRDRRAVRYLQSLPDELLHDIGVTRGDIAAAVQGRFMRSASGWIVPAS